MTRVFPLQALPVFKDLTIAIAHSERRGDIEVRQAGQCLSWHRARKHVTSYDDMIDTGSANFLDYGFELPVNVVDSCRPPHGHLLR